MKTIKERAKAIIFEDEFQFAQVFRSQSKNFEGTEAQFLEAGHAYEYVQVDRYTRRVVP